MIENNYNTPAQKTRPPVLSASDLSNGIAGQGAVVLSSNAALLNANLGTPSMVDLTNGTNLPLSTGVTGTLPTGNGGLGSDNHTANGVPVFSSGTATVSTTPALGTPSSLTLTNATGLPVSGLTGLGTGVATALGTAVNTTNGVMVQKAETSWTPTDGSGASLSLTVTNATYTQIGPIVFYQAQITYPSTADASPADINGLPFTSNASIYSVGAVQTNSSLSFVPRVNQNSKDIIFVTTAGGTVTNAQLSTHLVILTGFYFL